MPARLIFRQKFIYPDGAIREMVLWQLPKLTADRPHGLKYRLYYTGRLTAPVWYDTTMRRVRVIIGITATRRNRML